MVIAARLCDLEGTLLGDRGEVSGSRQRGQAVGGTERIRLRVDANVSGGAPAQQQQKNEEEDHDGSESLHGSLLRFGVGPVMGSRGSAGEGYLRPGHSPLVQSSAVVSPMA